MTPDELSRPDHQSTGPDAIRPPATVAASTRSQFLKRAALTGAGAMGASAVLAACGGGDSTGTAVSSGPALATGGTPKLQAKFKNKTVGVPIYTTLEEEMVVLLEFMEEAAEVGGLNWKFISDDTKASQPAAEAAVQSYINRGVDLIIDDTVPAAFLEPQFAAAKKKGIPVLGAYTFATPASSLTADYSILLGNEASLLAQYIVGHYGALGEKNVKVAMIDAALEVLEPRRWAFESVIEHAPGFEIVAQDFDVDITNLVPDATRRTEAILQKDSDLSCLWVGLPSLALPVTSAVGQAGAADVEVFGHSPGAAGVEAVQEQNSPLQAITWGDLRYNAYGLIDLALQALAGEEVSKQASVLLPIPVTVFGPENVTEEVPKGTDAKDWSFGAGTYVTYFTSKWQQKYGA